MPKFQERYQSINGKRQILVADDEWINRELMGNILADEYEILFAADGQEALDQIRDNKETLSLVLLDLMMPVLSGIEVLRHMKEESEDPLIRQIPVIVITSDSRAEVESLTLGASDFIPKPYPQPDVIKARIWRTIELFEDRAIIRSTERDTLTGLYNKEYFYRYAEQFDHLHRGMDMDAIVVDVNHFHMLNERFGAAYGDEVLRRIGEKVQEMVSDTGGIVCRREADTFMIYCPHGKDYQAILENASVGLAGDDSANNRVRLRMGVYAEVDKTLEIARRFDRAKMAADTVRNSFTKTIGIYDNKMHEKELYAEQLIEDFQAAITGKQFKVFYQPKFDVRPEIPVLASAEALVRWQHPTLGMISPGVFIPLFENNGLIQTLDHYVWREAAAQIRRWRDDFGLAVPVSVNVSRIDMYDPRMIDTLWEILQENELDAGELLLEITESAYTQDSQQIIEKVNLLRSMGFKIEMDDFGTGYSSLNMISSLPIDALKLDMQFIRNAFSGRKDTRMLEIIIDIADYLEVPVIAEGVETEEQLIALKAMGCDLVQGYYFSRPVPAEEYERFVIERKNRGDVEAGEFSRVRRLGTEEHAFGRIAYALSRGFESIYYVDAINNHYVEFGSEGRYEDLQIRRSGEDFFEQVKREIPQIVFLADQKRVGMCMEKEALLEQLAGLHSYSLTYRLVKDNEPVYYRMKAVRAENGEGRHIIIGISNIDAEITEEEKMEAEIQKDTVTYASIAQALSSDYFSLYYVNTKTDRFVGYQVHGEEHSLSRGESGDQFFALDRNGFLRDVHPEDIEMVRSTFTREKVMEAMEQDKTFTLTYRLMFDGIPTYVHMKVNRMADRNDPHIVIGVSNVDEQIRREQEHMKALRMANQDALTGVKSKHAYLQEEKKIDEQILESEAPEFAVAVCDINGLKRINDTQGHNAGDMYIREACRIVCHVFKHSPVYRIGGDEFTAILRGGDYEERERLMREMQDKNAQHAAEGKVLVASGLSEYRPGEDNSLAAVFERADAAMYEDKKRWKQA